MKNGILLLLLLGICGCNLRLKPVTDPFYDAVLTKYPANQAALFAQGQLLTREGRYQDAAKYYARMIKVAPEEAKGWFGWGRCLFELHQFKKAQQAFQQAVRLSPNPDTWLDLATAALMNGEIRQARDLAQKIRTQYGPSAALLRLEGDIAFVAGDDHRALQLYRESCQKDPAQRNVQNRIHDLEEYLTSPR